MELEQSCGRAATSGRELQLVGVSVCRLLVKPAVKPANSVSAISKATLSCVKPADSVSASSKEQRLVVSVCRLLADTELAGFTTLCQQLVKLLCIMRLSRYVWGRCAKQSGASMPGRTRASKLLYSA